MIYLKIVTIGRGGGRAVGRPWGSIPLFEVYRDTVTRLVVVVAASALLHEYGHDSPGAFDWLMASRRTLPGFLHTCGVMHIVLRVASAQPCS